MTAEPFKLPATQNCPIRGKTLPLVIMSHGRGRSFVENHDLAETLADAGFIVVAINHPGDNALDLSNFNESSIYVSRPNDIRRTLDFVLDRSPLKASIDPHAIGFFGFSRGGFGRHARLAGVEGVVHSEASRADVAALGIGGAPNQET